MISVFGVDVENERKLCDFLKLPYGTRTMPIEQWLIRKMRLHPAAIKARLMEAMNPTPTPAVNSQPVIRRRGYQIELLGVKFMCMNHLACSLGFCNRVPNIFNDQQKLEVMLKDDFGSIEKAREHLMNAAKICNDLHYTRITATNAKTSTALGHRGSQYRKLKRQCFIDSMISELKNLKEIMDEEAQDGRVAL